MTRIVGALEAEPWRLDLIRRYAEPVERWGLKLDRAYPGEDMVPICFYGLYLAAAEWDSSRSSFFRWLKLRIRNAVNPVVRRRRRWRERAKPIRIFNATNEVIDDRYYYT